MSATRSVSFIPVSGHRGNQEAQSLVIDVYVEGSRIRSFDDGNFIAVYFGRLVRFLITALLTNGLTALTLFVLQLADGSARPLIRTFNVKTREYYGNTSMDAEISLLMANQALV